jgi:hypothetical protein
MPDGTQHAILWSSEQENGRMKYVEASKFGGPEVLTVIEKETI